MKKILLSLWILVLTLTTLTAQISRELVLVEIGTGTGCQFCPGAAMGLHDLYANGDPVAGIEYHAYNSSDPYYTSEAVARCSYYSISGYPTAQFDGEYDEYSGGSTSSSMYSSYLPIVTSRMAIQTNFDIEIWGDNTGNNYNIIVRVEKYGSYSGTNLKVRFALTETDIAYSWYGQTEIEYCERLMSPDENGTAISFTSGDVQDVNLSFTFDNTWVASNCELIAWIQDESNKYVLHTASVMLPNLQPDAASSNFSASSSQVCEGNTVQFTDLSTGAITSWNWTFEGGNPSTSTDQNPIVTYPNQGSYDVTLEVTDGTTTSSLTQPDMVETIVAPVQPDQPTGETSICNAESTIYTTNSVPYAETYTWEISPSNAGTITSNGNEATFDANSSFSGNYTVSVRADNSCGEGTWSTPLSCTMFITPAAFQLSSGGGICEGSQGIEITLNGSETDINYELLRDGVSTGTILSGTGNSLTFGYQNIEGTYSVVGSNTNCEVQMYGTPWIYYLETPEQPEPPSGSSTACNNAYSNYIVSAVDYADTIYWDLTPIGAGTVISNNFDADIQWSEDFSGIAYLTAQGGNECGNGPVSDATEITVYETPNPYISGLSQVCDNESEEYTVEETTGSTYEWTVTGGEITSGAGTATVTVLWGDPGTGSILVTETTANDCSGASEEFDVIIDNCTEIDENNANAIAIYPNPATSHVDIMFNHNNGQGYQILIYNTLGQVVDQVSGVAYGNQQKVNIDISNYKAGLYVVNIVAENGLNIQRTFEKSK